MDRTWSRWSAGAFSPSPEIGKDRIWSPGSRLDPGNQEAVARGFRRYQASDRIHRPPPPKCAIHVEHLSQKTTPGGADLAKHLPSHLMILPIESISCRANGSNSHIRARHGSTTRQLRKLQHISAVTEPRSRCWRLDQPRIPLWASGSATTPRKFRSSTVTAAVTVSLLSRNLGRPAFETVSTTELLSWRSPRRTRPSTWDRRWIRDWTTSRIVSRTQTSRASNAAITSSSRWAGPGRTRSVPLFSLPANHPTGCPPRRRRSRRVFPVRGPAQPAARGRG